MKASTYPTSLSKLALNLLGHSYIERTRIEPGPVSRKMSFDQITSLLVQHGIEDITHKLDFEHYSSEPVARGGFGSIHQGVLRDGVSVAVKRIDIQCNRGLGEDHCKHAAHELYTWSKCDHPGVLDIMGFALAEGFILLISPWIKNGSLTSYLARNRSCDRLGICISIAGVVEYLHGEGIVHGDIKADNMLVSEKEEVKLADFGSATLIEYVTLFFTRTSPQLAGSVRFSAPEILDESSKRHTVKSDIYALGMSILHILTGSLPYAEDSNMRALSKIFRGQHPPRPEFDDIVQEQDAKDKLWNMLTHCWETDPNLRPTGAEVKRTLIELEE